MPMLHQSAALPCPLPANCTADLLNALQRVWQITQIALALKTVHLGDQDHSLSGAQQFSYLCHVPEIFVPNFHACGIRAPPPVAPIHWATTVAHMMAPELNWYQDFGWAPFRCRPHGCYFLILTSLASAILNAGWGDH